MALDLRKRSATVAGRSVSLTAIQFDVSASSCASRAGVWTRLEILKRAVGACYEGYERTIDAHIKNIRKAIGDDSENPKYSRHDARSRVQVPRAARCGLGSASPCCSALPS